MKVFKSDVGALAGLLKRSLTSGELEDAVEKRMIENAIAKNVFHRIYFGQPGGMRWPPVGIIGGGQIERLLHIFSNLKANLGFRKKDSVRFLLPFV